MWVPLPGKTALVRSLLASSLAPPTAPPTTPAQAPGAGSGAPAAAAAVPRPEYSRYTLPETAHGDSGESKKWREIQTAGESGYISKIFSMSLKYNLYPPQTIRRSRRRSARAA